MNPFTRKSSLACAAALAFALPAFGADIFMNPKDIKWGAAPPSMPKGAKLAVLYGDPGKAGPYAIRLMAPANYKVPPHHHSRDEQLTIISGTLYLRPGEKADTQGAMALNAGGYHFVPAKSPHYAYTKVPTVLQLSGEGPFDLVYVNPADDPEKKGAKSEKAEKKTTK